MNKIIIKHYLKIIACLVVILLLAWLVGSRSGMYETFMLNGTPDTTPSDYTNPLPSIDDFDWNEVHIDDNEADADDLKYIRDMLINYDDKDPMKKLEEIRYVFKQNNDGTPYVPKGARMGGLKMRSFDGIDGTIINLNRQFTQDELNVTFNMIEKYAPNNTRFKRSTDQNDPLSKDNETIKAFWAYNHFCELKQLLTATSDQLQNKTYRSKYSCFPSK
jgi:hypothetical protein